jgi:CDGSH-type Zn-finger protein
MGLCKCGLSSDYPECNGTHNSLKNEQLRQAIVQAFEENKHLLEDN